MEFQDHLVRIAGVTRRPGYLAGDLAVLRGIHGEPCLSEQHPYQTLRVDRVLRDEHSPREVRGHLRRDRSRDARCGRLVALDELELRRLGPERPYSSMVVPSFG